MTTAENSEHRRAYSHKIYLFSNIIWDEDETLLAGAYAGSRNFIDKMLTIIRERKGQPETLNFINDLMRHQLGICRISQLYVTNKAVYFKESSADSNTCLRRIAHTVYIKASKKEVRRVQRKRVVVLGVGEHTLRDLWMLTHHELTSEELVFLANGYSLSVGNGIDTWRIGDTTIQHRAEFGQDEKSAIAEKLSKHIMNITAQNFPTDEENVVVNI